MRYPHVAARVFDTPLLIARAKLGAVLSVLGPRLGFEVKKGEGIALFSDDDEDYEPVVESTPGYTIENGVARIIVYGTLLHRSDWLSSLSGLTSYQSVAEAFRAALADPQVAAIVFDIDSCGGEVSGCFDLGDEIFAARGQKPMVAVANEFALSGGYPIASAADEIVICQTGLVGSIGVVWTHVDHSEQNKMLGLAVTHIFKGKHKIDGDPEHPLTDQAKDSIGADMSKIYDVFVAVVARNRGMDAAAVIATEAEIYRGESGVAIGLADRVGTLKEVMEQLADTSRPPANTSGTYYSAGSARAERSSMKTNPAAGGDPAAPGMTDAEMQAEAARVVAAAKAEATAAAITAERTRIKSIMTHAEAAGRTEMASHLAFDTDMASDAAIALLGKAPKAEAAKGGGFEAQMDKTLNPKVGADTGKTGAAAEDAEAAQLASQVVAFSPRPARKSG